MPKTVFRLPHRDVGGPLLGPLRRVSVRLYGDSEKSHNRQDGTPAMRLMHIVISIVPRLVNDWLTDSVPLIALLGTLSGGVAKRLEES